MKLAKISEIKGKYFIVELNDKDFLVWDTDVSERILVIEQACKNNPKKPQ